MRAAYIGGWVLTFGFIVCAIVAGFAGILLQVGRFGALAVFSACLGGVFFLSMLSWLDRGKPKRALPRKMRRELRAEENRLRLQAEVERLERELLDGAA